MRRGLAPFLLAASSILVAAGAPPGAGAAPGDAPALVLPDTLHWVSPPHTQGLEAAWVLGAEDVAGPYILRAKLAPGARIAPHSHPDERSSAVLSGTLYIGFGTTFDEAKLVAVPEGSVQVVPAGAPHYVWAKDGAVSYQESGVGPTATVWVKKVPGVDATTRLAAEVRLAETAFAGTMAARDHAAFTSFLADEALFFNRKGVLRGRAAVASGWQGFFAGEEAPFSWAPETVEVLDSGTLALSSGPVRDPAGKQIGTFNSIWRREPGGQWKVVFDKGCPPCDCPPRS